MTKKMTWSQAIQALNQDYHMREPRPTQPEPVFNGWKLVPVKPTHKMETAIGKSRNLSASEIWEDAITAAPQPPQQVLTAAVIYEAIKHGDAKHQEWLRHALENVFAGRPVLHEATQPQQESLSQPVGLSKAVYTVLEGFTLPHDVRKILETAFYGPTPQPQPLTTEKIQQIALEHFGPNTLKWLEESAVGFAQAIEAAHNIQN